MALQQQPRPYRAGREHAVLGREVASYFTSNPRTKFIGFAGLGRHGGALILAQMSRAHPHLEQRRLVVKYSYGAIAVDQRSNADEDLRNEFRWLHRLRGAEHIVQLVPFLDTSLLLPGISDGEETYAQSVENTAEHNHEVAAAAVAEDRDLPPAAPPPRKCPTFALEYLPWGTLRQFMKRVDDAQVRYIPSRLLWRLWLCMVRQCVAMAFPPDVDEGEWAPPDPDDVEDVPALVIRETIQEDRDYFGLTQNSAHFDNFLFGNAAPAPGDDEHDPRLPVLKLIDFGRGKEESQRARERGLPSNPLQWGSRVNLLSAAMGFMDIACYYVGYQADISLEIDDVLYPYSYVDVEGVPRTVRTAAPYPMRHNEVIDPQLRHLLVRVLTFVSDEMPSLADVLAETEAAVANKGPDDESLVGTMGHQLGPDESDEGIKAFVQRFIYNA